MKDLIKDAVERRMPDKESIRINAMQEPKAAMPKKAYAVLAVAVMLAICTCIAVPMMTNEPEVPTFPVQTVNGDTTLSGNVTDASTDDTTERITLSTSPDFPWDQFEEPDEGIYIPAIELAPPESGVMADMKGFVVYGGKVYAQAEYIFCDYDEKDKYTGAYLGTAKGNYSDCCIVVPGDEHEPVDLTEDFTSNVTGDVYTVKGYNPAFRICIPDMYEGCPFIAFFECLNGVTLATGEDLYGEERLNIKDNYSKVYYHVNAYLHSNVDNGTELTELSEEGVAIFDEFVDKLMQSECTEYSYDGFLYEREHIVLKLEMKDSTNVWLTIFPEGYVYYHYTYTSYKSVMVKMEDEIFKELYNLIK